MSAAAVVELERVVKNYGGLRPLRISRLEIGAAERVAISGIDSIAAEVFVNLVTGAALPDEGSIRTFGRLTSEIADGDEWLTSLERFGIVSPRAVLLEAASLEQNLAMPFTLEIDPVPADVAQRVESLAKECGIDGGSLGGRVAEAPPAVRARTHLARAVALEPLLLILEHPTADLAQAERAAYGRDVATVAGRRGLAAIAITLDEEFAQAAAHRSLALNGATGALSTWKRRRWFL